MRAGIVLEALTSCYQVSVLVVPLFSSFDPEVPAPLRNLCERVITAAASVESASAAYGGCNFDVIHVFRLSAMPFARPYMTDGENRPKRHLDLDDIDSKTHKRMAAIARDNGDTTNAASASAEAMRCQLLEAAAFRVFDRVYVCAEADRRDLSQRSKAEVCVLPNTVRLPVAVAPPAGEVFRMLFVGTLGYYPNRDAVVYFCTQILPLIRKAARTPFEVDVAGGGASDKLHEFGVRAGLRMMGPVQDLRACYDSAHAIIVPLRAGGGTRIKILEAFSYGRPVVSTTIGVEGIDALPNQHVLVGDSPQEFAAHCLELMTNRALAEGLVERAGSLLSSTYSLEALQRVVASLSTAATHPGSRSDGG